MAKHDKLDIKCDQKSVKSVKTAKYLGVEIDQSLTGESVGNNILKKANSRLKFLYRQCKQLDSNIKMMLVSALILSHFDYAYCAIFSGMSATLKCKLQRCQNKIVRFALNLPSRAHVGVNEFKRSNILPVSHRVSYFKLNLMYNIVHDTSPSYLRHIGTTTTHRYQTRNSQSQLQLPFHKSFGQKSFHYTAVKLWNNLPIHIRQSNTPSQFKRLVKSQLFHEIETIENDDFVYY